MSVPMLRCLWAVLGIWGAAGFAGGAVSDA